MATTVKTHLEDMAAVEAVIVASNDVRVTCAALRLQLALLAEMTATIRGKLPKHKQKGLTDGLTSEEATMAYDGNKIPAIKEVRERTNCGLREAKELVEAYTLKHYGWTSKPNEQRYDS